LVVSSSAADADQFRRAGPPVIVVPNGCSLPADLHRAARLDEGAKVGFLGTIHPPNVTAARFILDKLAPRFPDVCFEFVGSVCEAVASNAGRNVVLHGVLSDRAKSEVMRRWRLALNPLEFGGGSSLKLPDYMAHGLATLNTAIGARGFEVVQYKAGQVVDLADFGVSLDRLLRDPAGLAIFGANAREYAERRLDWRQIVIPYREAIGNLLASPRAT
jgi:glycosyltransferase involved in cell wall biosynthesis